MIETIYALTMGSLYKDTWKYDLCLIGDVMEYIEDNLIMLNTSEKWDYFMPKKNPYTPYDWILWTLMDIWANKRKPIDEQSEECIKYVYDLITNQ